MMLYRVLSLWIVIILPLYLQAGDCTEIIGGREVDAHSIPYIALLENSKNNLPCGGILIHKKWVLTAAHCLEWGFPLLRGIKTVHLGVHSLKTATRDPIQSIEVEKNVPHPCYNAKTLQDDIMLLKLKNPVRLSNTVKIKPLPKPVQDIAVGTKCFVAGWGITEARTRSDVLLSVNVNVVGRNVCERIYRKDVTITDKMICAGYPFADACPGDSGGPLVCGDHKELRGVVSFGKRCDNDDIIKSPGVYTFISKYNDWIKDTINYSE